MIKINNQFIILVLFISLTSTIIATIDVAAETIPNEEYNANLLPIGTLGMDWTLQEVISGSTMSFSSFQGKVVLLDFFATWCIPCKNFVPKLKEVKAQFSTNQLVIISLDTDPENDDIATIKTFAEDEGMDWYIFIDTKGISTFYEISSIPTFYILNYEQRVTFSGGGGIAASTIIGEINKLVHGPQTTTSTSSNGEPISGFWARSWYWFLIIGVFLIIGATIFIQRLKVQNYNKKVQQQRLEEKQRRTRKRWR